MLPTNSVFANNVLENGIDELVDSNGVFIQQALPFATDFLEPCMDEETLAIHFKYHHGGAIKGANKDMAKIKLALDNDDLDMVDLWTRKLSYHFSSHVLHSIFWTNLTNSSVTPKGELLKRIEKDFGSLDKLKGLIAKVSKSVEGSGWGLLTYQPYADRLMVMQCQNHQKLNQVGAVPLLVIDVWEHAYYLKYRNKRSDFVLRIGF